MRDFLKSAASFVWATALFSASQLPRAVTRGPKEGHMPGPSGETQSASGRLDTRTLAAIGGGLTAGIGNFAWSEESQGTSYVAQAAVQMETTCLAPLIQAPGLYGAPGLPIQPVVVPGVLQTTVVDEFPPRRRYNNLALPGYELHDCRHRRPAPPLIHRDDVRQTAANLVLGLPALTTDHDAARPTQLECALELRPTLAIVELGYEEILRLLLGERRGLDDSVWITEYEAVVKALRQCGAEVVVASIPSPLDTAACLSLDAAARALRVSIASLQRRYGLDAADRMTVAGLTTAAFHLLGGAGDSLAAEGVVRAAAAQGLAGRIERLNAAIAGIADRNGAVVFDLHALFESVHVTGVCIEDRTVTSDFLGGFYTINGAYPGAAGHAVIANALLTCLNGAFGSTFPGVDVSRLSRDDAVLDYRGATGAERGFPPRPAAVVVPPAISDPPARRRSASRPPVLQLPPNLEITLPLARHRSYHGDAIRVVDCRDSAVARFGSCADVAFGGPVLFDSHLSGALHIRFSPPQGSLTRFEVTFDPLEGDDGVLSAPMFFRWPVRQCRVMCEPGVISGGTLDLATGEVTDMQVAVRYLNSALQALVGVNPGFPDQPILFPGQYGSAWARFDSREDNSLDFTFYGSTFLPLGGQFGPDDVRWALPFVGAGGQFASMPARGMALHPHLQLTTREIADEDALERRPAPVTTGQVPPNQVRELTLFTRRSSFGDRFTLNTPELGGPAVGRSHLLGRLLVQTGEPSAGSVPVAMWLLPPGGLLGQQPPGALASLFPGRLSPGPVGHDEHLRFPIRNYFLDAVTLVDDPFDSAVGLLDLDSGRFLNQPLHRAFIGQDLFFALIRVEPRTPKDSFFFRGTAVLQRDASEGLVFRQQAIVRVPYPAGFGFPAPDLTSAITVGADSVLDPYLWLHAITDRTEGEAVTITRDLESSTGERFWFCLELLDGAAQPLRFLYTNHAQQGSFRLETVSWFGRSCLSSEAGETDVFTFTGFGRWSKDPTQRAHQVAAQIAVGNDHYVSIQIDSGLVSNVNTRPVDEVAAMP
jgi:hypothetical protein